jgi:hypothetical protein
MVSRGYTPEQIINKLIDNTGSCLAVENTSNAGLERAKLRCTSWSLAAVSFCPCFTQY